MSTMRNRSRVTSPPVLLVNLRLISNVPSVEVFGSPGVAFRTLLGGKLETTKGSIKLATIDHSVISNNTAGAQGGGVFNGSGSLALNFNVIVGNTSGNPASTGLRNNTGAINADNNWWGCNQGPSTTPCDRVSGPLGSGIAAWLTLSHTASPSAIEVNQSTTLQADFFTNNLSTGIGASDLVALNGRPVVFNNAVLGTISGADPAINGGKANATFTAGATGGNGSADATVDAATVTVSIFIGQADTQAPAITCPANIVVDAPEGECAAQVNFSITAQDNCPGTVTINSSPASGSVFPVGTTTVNASATDASGNVANCSFTVTVRDKTAPVITLNGQTPVLWPPDHDYRTINVTDLVASASDECDAGVDINDVVISQVSSDELEDGPADGSTVNDMVIAANCKSVQLRAERQASGNGRVYTITFKVTDAGGNTFTITAQVIVPATSAGSGAVLGPGPGYTVMSACP
ncbi:MAG: HYR domain-containing protein [Pyrinomonadaceae bacterium]